jgi:RNB domain-containing protein
MVLHVVRVTDSPPTWYTDSLRTLEAQLEVPDAFPADVVSAAEAAAREPRLPELDRTDIPFVTLDPAGSMDLDQAFHIERRAPGLRVYYAIADVAAFVDPDGPIDQEAHRRVETLYAPDRKVPLYPTALSAGAASLLPGELRGRRRRSTSAGRWCGRPRSSTTHPCSTRWMPAAAARGSTYCASSASFALPVRPIAEASASRCPSRS